MSGEPKGVGDILRQLRDEAEGQQHVALGDVVQSFGSRTYGVFLTLPALLDLSPLGAIPGVPSVVAAIIILFAAQIALGRKHIWLPGWLARRSLSTERVKQAAKKLEPYGEILDRQFHRRLPQLATGSFIRAAAVICIGLALTVPPLELFPFASSAPLLAIAVIGLALLFQDGLVMIVAIILSAVAVAASFGYLI